MTLENKKAAFLGDSITEGWAVHNRANRYPDRLFSDEKMSSIQNLGIAGTCIARQTAEKEAAGEGSSFVERYKDIDPNQDYIFVFGGTNDYENSSVPLGSPEDISADTFCGAVNFLCENLRKHYPDSIIIFLTPVHRLGDRDTKGKNGHYLSEFVDAIRCSCRRCGIPVIDLWSEVSFDPNNEEDMKKYCHDGLHPNDEGHRIIADCIKKKLKEL